MSTQPAWWKSTEAMVAGILLLAMVLIGLVNPAFWSLENLFSLARSNIVIGIMALGVLLVMISGGIDVSFPAFAAAAAYLVVRAMVDWGWPTGVLIPFVLATLLGAASRPVSILPLSSSVSPGFQLATSSLVSVSRLTFLLLL